MFSANLAEIKEKISALHEGDEKQLEVIFSDRPRLIVEAPAGYGKTTTMISRIAYQFASGQIPNPKRILGLTFSVNAALKIKRDVAEKLPSLLASQASPLILGEKVSLTNYHGFCKIILKKYGYLVTDVLRKDINRFRAVGENEIEKKSNLKKELSTSELEHLKKIEAEIKRSKFPNSQDVHDYNEIVLKKLLPMEHITHNAVILFVLEMFDRFVELKKFYQSYYPLIVVDEFQDTNCIAWRLLESVISDQSQLLFLGDPLQRIYGFMGALQDIMTVASKKYKMAKVTLSKNYRFYNNQEMLKLDKNIRLNASTRFAPIIDEEDMAKLPAFWGNSQQDEARQIVAKVKCLMGNGTDKIAILFRGRSKNAETVEKELVEENVPYFFGMFTDEDLDYINFHNKCQDMFIKRFGRSKNINKQALVAFFDSVKTAYASASGKTIDSLLHLLDALIKKASIDYAALLSEDKYNLFLDIFENHQLKQSIEYIDSQIILSTVHGAKGLEWDYVILADVERWVFPNYFTCNECQNKFNKIKNRACSLSLPLSSSFQETLLDELSVFYVGITRARKQAFVSASAKRYDYSANEKDSIFSCMVSIDGIKLVKANTFRS